MSGNPILTPLDGTIGTLARSKREEKGLSQEKIAIVLGVSVPQVSYLENGKRAWSIKNIYDLAKFYSIDPVEFLGGVKIDQGDMKLLGAIKERLSIETKIEKISDKK